MKTMTFCVISIDHYLQYVEAEGDSEALRGSKELLRAILLEKLGAGTVGIIFEESSPAKPSIAQELAAVGRIPWHNICMTTEERVEAGIYDALRNRPGAPDWDDMSCWIECRIPEDEIRETYFVQRIASTAIPHQATLVLLGDMHVQEVANKLLAQGHEVEIVQELVPKRRWANPIRA